MFEFLGYLTIGLIPGLIIVDWAIRGRKHDSTRFWRVRATLVTIATFYLAGYFAVFWAALLGDYHLFDLSGLGTWAGAGVGISSAEVAAPALKRGQVARVRVPEIARLKRRLGLALRANRAIRGPLAAFLDVLRKERAKG